MRLRRFKPNKAHLRVATLAILIVMSTLVILSAMFPFPEGTWDFLSIGTSERVAASPGWLTGYDYRKSHNLTGATGAGTNYQVRIRLHKGAGTDSDEHGYLENHCDDFPNDVRFTDNDETTELDHWLEKETIDRVSEDIVHAMPFSASEPLQRKAFYANGRYWAFFVNDTDVLYYTSTDGLKWTIGATDSGVVKSSVTSGRGMAFALFYDSSGGKFHYAYAWESDISYRSGTPNADGTITWTTTEATITTDHSMARTPSVAVDTEGYCWIAYPEHDNASADVVKSGNNDGTWGTTASGFPDSVTTAERYISIVPLSSAKMLTVYASSYGAVYAKRWNGSSWDSELTADNNCDYGENHCAVGDGDDAHIVFQCDRNDGSNPYDLFYVFFDGSESTLDSDEEIQALSAYAGPVISKSGSTQYCFWMGDPAAKTIYYKARSGGSWDGSPTTLATETDDFTNNARISATYEFSSNLGGVMYQVGDNAGYSEGAYGVGFCSLDAGLDEAVDFWVEVVDDLSSGTVPIYIYCGKNGASSASNGANTFLAFLDKDSTSGWSLGGSLTVTTSGDFLRFNNEVTANIGSATRTDFSMSPTKWQMEARLKNISLGTNDQTAIFLIDGAAATRFTQTHSPRYNDQPGVVYYDGAVKEIGTDQWVEGIEYVFIQRVDESDSSTGVDFYLLSKFRSSLASVNNENFAYGSPTDCDGIIIGDYSDGAVIDGYIRWLFIRKIVDTEPTHGSWGEWEAFTVEITNTPGSNDFGVLEVNGTGQTAIDYFTITNTGNCAVDVVIYGTDATGGDDTWTLSDTATPGENIYGLKAGLDDVDDTFDVIVRKTETYNTLVSDLAEDATQDWGLKIWMPTSVSGYDAQQMTATITLVASESS